jgi:hypothetical protein
MTWTKSPGTASNRVASRKPKSGSTVSLPPFEHSKTCPHRCPVAEESEELGQEVRLLLYGKRNRQYKMFYAVQKETRSTGTVRLFHVRHWARKSLNTHQLRELMGVPTT